MRAPPQLEAWTQKGHFVEYLSMRNKSNTLKWDLENVTADVWNTRGFLQTKYVLFLYRLSCSVDPDSDQDPCTKHTLSLSSIHLISFHLFLAAMEPQQAELSKHYVWTHGTCQSLLLFSQRHLPRHLIQWRQLEGCLTVSLLWFICWLAVLLAYLLYLILNLLAYLMHVLIWMHFV